MFDRTGGRGRFPTTRWSLIVAAQKKEPATGVLNAICEIYWYPVYAFIRRKGHGAADGEDLTQGFFAYLLEKQSVRAVDRDLGKFRAFLLGSLKHFLAHERERAQAQKRGGLVPHVSFDSDTAERLYQLEPRTEATPDQIFERRWALQLLDTAVEQLRSEYQEEDKGRQFEVLGPFVERDGDAEYGRAAESLGMTIGAVRVAVHRLRLRFRVVMRQLVAATVSSPDLVDDEIRDLLNVLSR